jgi:hypothetical protein
MVRRRRLDVVILAGFLVFSGVDALGQTPQASDVLRLYKQSLSWMESVSMKVDIDGAATGYPDRTRTAISFLFRRDKDRVEWRGWLAACDPQGNIDANTHFTINDIVAGGRYISFADPVGGPSTIARMTANYGEYLKRLLEDTTYGGPLWGRIFGSNHKSVADLLGASADTHLRAEQESIGGLSCYVLEGTSQYGRTTAWVSPDMGYSALKWSIEKTAGDLFDGRQIPAGSWVVVFDSVKLLNINGAFVPTEGMLTHTNDDPEGQGYVTREHYRVSDIQLAPDFNAPGAFKVDLPNGTRVQVEEAPGIRYVWQDGQIVPAADGPAFEEIDRMVEQFKGPK